MGFHFLTHACDKAALVVQKINYASASTTLFFNSKWRIKRDNKMRKSDMPILGST